MEQDMYLLKINGRERRRRTVIFSSESRGITNQYGPRLGLFQYLEVS